MSKSILSNSSIGATLFIIFLVLKLTHVIDWSWWWITAPLWCGLALFIIVLLISGIVYIIKHSFFIRKNNIMSRTDKERLDFLQELTNKGNYTRKVVLRWSTSGRGWRLHETSREDAVADVRIAIDKFIDMETTSD